MERKKNWEKNDFFSSVCILYPSLSLQHLHHWETFAEAVSPPLKMLSFSSWSYSHLILTYTVSTKICSPRVSLQTASGDVPAPGFLFYPSVLSYRSGPKFKTCTFVSTVYLTFQPRGWSYFHIFHLSPLGAVLVKGAFFFSTQKCQKTWGQHSSVPSYCAATASENVKEVLSVFDHPQSFRA